ncbi:Uncharacterized protein PCOAH_00036670 [Plasmodium coatneyi]|uniref:Schizont-infected cell agglutination extracellular alpha domain-containing protein n=1 Tax=Plasmodium coatneyi TaxID=208452 RepID=A0A1B1E245_9APIC|nr:Uncharacterized protein PCOAH_00036670 [Plasmodium coatneyi]ANQ08909.1 Uncharacterized protein PCOAH_00036670 [Plasmodium coatneyi]
MMYNIEKDGQQDQKMCSTLENKEREKELCKLLLRIFFWMDGLRQQVPNVKGGSTGQMIWIRRNEETKVKKEEEDLEHYYRCLIGKVTLVKMLGKHCKLKDVSDVVMKDVGNMRTRMNIPGGNKFCKDVDFGSLRIGGTFMWGKIKEWIDAFTIAGSYGVELPEVEKGQSKLHDIQKKGQKKEICPEGEVELDPSILEKLEIKFIDDSEDLSLDEAIDPPGKETSGGKKELEEVLKEAMEANDREEAFLAKTLQELLLKKHLENKAKVEKKKAEEQTATLTATSPGK